MRALLVRGLIAGLIGGVAAAVFAYFAGEGSVNAAIGFEDAHSHEHEKELVSRGVQSTLGLLVANVGVGVALGGLFAVAFALVYGRFGLVGPRTHAALLGVGGFIAVSVVPFLKYPANPPGVGAAGTIDSRTDLYFSYLGISVIVAGLAVYGARVLADRVGGWPAGTAGVVGYVVVMGVCGALMPAVDEVPDHFPASVLWEFRVTSLGTLAVLWAAVAVAFGALVHRSLTAKAAAADAVAV